MYSQLSQYMHLDTKTHKKEFSITNQRAYVKITSDRAARSKIRLESDLEPGNLTVPEISLMGCSTISGTVDAFSAVATEAKTFNWLILLTVKIESLFKTHEFFDEFFRFLEPKNNEHEVEAEDLALGVGNLGELRLCAILVTCAIMINGFSDSDGELVVFWVGFLQDSTIQQPILVER